jgi:hypothetical protein
MTEKVKPNMTLNPITTAGGGVTFVLTASQHAKSRVRKVESTRRRSVPTLVAGLAGELEALVYSLNRNDWNAAEITELLPELKSLLQKCNEVRAKFDDSLLLKIWFRVFPDSLEQYVEAIERLDSLVETWELSLDGSIYEMLQQRLQEAKA